MHLLATQNINKEVDTTLLMTKLKQVSILYNNLVLLSLKDSHFLLTHNATCQCQVLSTVILVLQLKCPTKYITSV